MYGRGGYCNPCYYPAVPAYSYGPPAHGFSGAGIAFALIVVLLILIVILGFGATRFVR
ncbi:hypothetical protein J2S74_001256 [Evansella vedderi]|uniref:YjcZ family sporulation protein n=1 Tax=Evansella vedderi TaxID=38282 RepID=A0ABT9ZSP9_9BACI|nr:sporulation protein YjcZ [Evansella vedderi]MDQ0253884.1 hypothetical protein [Evansella vedderi]